MQSNLHLAPNKRKRYLEQQSSKATDWSAENICNSSGTEHQSQQCGGLGKAEKTKTVQPSGVGDLSKKGEKEESPTDH